MVCLMNRFALSLAAIASLIATALPAQAACYAEYKAKRDNPLELYYDVAKISGPCTVKNAKAQLRKRLKAEGLTLLKVLSVTEN